jgi:uncharacterized protein YdeI (YjbR/CyaY-like superfamily)
MPKKDKRIDAYIAKSQDFAKPILKHLRELIHNACPEVEETIKWSFPHFDYAGGTICSMASFKHHCAFGFWKAPVMKDPHKILSGKDAMGDFGKITGVKDLPADKIMIEYIKEAARLNKEGVKLPAKTKTGQKKNLVIPDYFLKALSKNKKALKTFEDFSPTNKREYVEWVNDAKTEETRNNRLTTAIEWMTEGKIRNWKYIKK